MDKEESAPGRLDECFLKVHNLFPPVSLTFLPDFHDKMLRSWRKPYSVHLLAFLHSSYVNVKGLANNGYVGLPQVEETLVSYLPWHSILTEGFSPALYAMPAYNVAGGQSIHGDGPGWWRTPWRCYMHIKPTY